MLRRRLTSIGVLAVALVACATAIGPRPTWPFAPDETNARILMQIRLPRVALGFLAGAALATGGMACQALFRNVLATPYTIGVSAGASLGAAIYVHAGITTSMVGISGHVLAAFLGAIASLALVFALGRSAGGFPPATLLLAGVAVSFLCTSVILAIQYAGDVTTSFRVGRWLVGGLEVVGFAAVWHILPFVLIGLLVLTAASRELDLLVFGDEAAATRGVSIQAVRHRVFGATALMVGAVVAVCGPIGFVGLIVPHVGRLLLGPRHATLGPFCVVMGGTFLVVCDTVARTLFAPIEIPVGIVTALAGGPFFLALLVHGPARIRVRG